MAHEGPPFPILVDEPLADYVVSVWADPDIGEARFFIIVETAEGDPPEGPPSVTMWTEPESGRLARETWKGTRQSLKNKIQFQATPYFDQRDFWSVGFQISPPGDQPHELTARIESTPPGLGPWDFAIYLFPFLLFGGMWAVAILRRRKIANIDISAPPAGSGKMWG